LPRFARNDGLSRVLNALPVPLPPMWVTFMTEHRFPEQGILWRGWNDDTRSVIAREQRPVLLFVADTDPAVWPFLRETLREMPANARLRALLHDFFLPLLVEAQALPEYLKDLGAGSSFHIAVLSPSGLTPMVTVDPVSGDPADTVESIVLILERLAESRRS
jgi:hypothetical protein